MNNKTFILCALVVLSFFAALHALSGEHYFVALVLFANMLAAVHMLDRHTQVRQ